MASISFKPQFLAACTLLLALLICSLPAARAQNNCPAQLTVLNRCAVFVMPGAPASTPSPECCSAIESVGHDCLCSTLDIVTRLPARCNMAPNNCNA